MLTLNDLRNAKVTFDFKITSYTIETPGCNIYTAIYNMLSNSIIVGIPFTNETDKRIIKEYIESLGGIVNIIY